MLQSEGIAHFEPLAPAAFNEQLRETLLCFVLMGPAAAHAFCSRYDFGPWPLLPGVDCLPADVHRVCSADLLALKDHSMAALLQAQLLLQPLLPSDVPRIRLDAAMETRSVRRLPASTMQQELRPMLRRCCRTAARCLWPAAASTSCRPLSSWKASTPTEPQAAQCSSTRGREA